MNGKNWLQISLINLLLLSAVGAILRYKIAFSLPQIDQGNLLHGHSHFAFCGWVSQAIMAIIVSRLSAHSGRNLLPRYSVLFCINLVCAYGMLISFTLQGYGLFSICFSTGSLVVSYFFMVFVWKDLALCKEKTMLSPWWKAAVFFNAFSSLGAWALAYMMATGNMHQHQYLAAVYFFLHFQYNGWFSFAILGLLSEKLAEARIHAPQLRSIFFLFFLACMPAYFLSALWMPIPVYIYILVVVAAIIQMAAWLWMVHLFRKRRKILLSEFSKIPYTIIVLSLAAFSIKFTLQLVSTIPSLSAYAFGFRPIVIGYLHLVLLGAISLFLIGYTMLLGVIKINKTSSTGIVLFITGVIFNECLLMIQGFAAMNYIPVLYINELLFMIAMLMFSGMVFLNFSLLESTGQKITSENSK